MRASLFQLYSPRLEPKTPVLRIISAMGTSFGVSEGFLTHATVSPDGNETYDYQGWFLITSSGDIKPVTKTRAVGWVRPGGIQVDENTAYRPSERRLFQFPRPAGKGHRRMYWRIDLDGRTVWVCRARGTTGEVVSSSDGGRSWQHAPVAVVTDRTGPGLTYRCYLRDGYLVLVLLDQQAATGVGSIAWPSGGPVAVTPTQLGKRFDPWRYQLLPGARMAFGTMREACASPPTPPTRPSSWSRRRCR